MTIEEINQRVTDLMFSQGMLNAQLRGATKDFVTQANKLWLDYWKNALQENESVVIEFAAYAPINPTWKIFENFHKELVSEFYANLAPNSHGYFTLTIMKQSGSLNFEIKSTVNLEW